MEEGGARIDEQGSILTELQTVWSVKLRNKNLSKLLTILQMIKSSSTIFTLETGKLHEVILYVLRNF